MEKRNFLGIGTIAAAFIFSVVAVSVAYAAYNRDLTIEGTATAKKSTWSVVFKSGSLSAASTGNAGGVTSTAREVTHPTLTDTTISTYSVELKTPGDYVTYNFIIKNAGDFPAQIGSGFTMPTPTCTKGASGADSDTAYVCGGTVSETPVASNLEYTLKYVDSDDNSVDEAIRVSAGDAVSVGDKFTPGLEREVQLKILYKTQSGTTPHLPTDDVTIGNLGITIPFVQY